MFKIAHLLLDEIAVPSETVIDSRTIVAKESNGSRCPTSSESRPAPVAFDGYIKSGVADFPRQCFEVQSLAEPCVRDGSPERTGFRGAINWHRVGSDTSFGRSDGTFSIQNLSNSVCRNVELTLAVQLDVQTSAIYHWVRGVSAPRRTHAEIIKRLARERGCRLTMDAIYEHAPAL